MAHSNRRWSIPARRFGTSVVLGVIGIFVLCGGVGMTNWMVGAIGLAVVAVAVGIYVMSAMNSRTFSYIPGTAHVVSASEPPASASRGRANLHIVITARNITGVAVKIRDANVPVAKWPDAGADLPILVAVGDPRRVRVLWDEVRAHGVLTDTSGVRDADEPLYVYAPSDPHEFDDAVGFDDADGLEDTDGFEGGVEFEDSTGFADPVSEVSLSEAEYDVASAADDPSYADNAAYADGAAFGTEAAYAQGADYAADDAAEADYPTSSFEAETDADDARRVDAARDDDGAVADAVDDPDAFAADDADDADLTASVVPDGRGGQVIELDVMDPSVVRWSAEPATPAVPVPMATVVTAPPERRRPSPRPRRAPDDAIVAPAEAVVAVSFADDAPTIPVRIQQARVVTPAVPAVPDADEVFDQFAAGDHDASGTAAEVTEAYLAATPPPGTSRPGRIKSVAVTLFVTDLSRSIVFYRDTLGFAEADAGRGSAVLESGDARIVLRRVAMPPVDRRLVQLLLEVPDLQAGYEDLRTRGVSFIHRPRPVGQYEQNELWAAAFRDPDGHGIAITQWRSL